MPPKPQQHQVNSSNISNDNRMPRRANHTEPAVEIEYDDEYDGPVDLDLLFATQTMQPPDDGSLFGSDDSLGGRDDDQDADETLPLSGGKYFANPNRRLLDTDASLIPGSPFSKPPNRRSNRPSEPLSIAKYASTMAFLITVGWVVFLLMVPFWNYQTVGRIIVEMILALLSFFGLFWNSCESLHRTAAMIAAATAAAAVSY